MEQVLTIINHIAYTISALAITLLLVSPDLRNLLAALKTRAETEAKQRIVETEAATSTLLVAAIHAAFAYALSHLDEVKKEFSSIDEYVQHSVENDARFFDVADEWILHLIPQVKLNFKVPADDPAKAPVAPVAPAPAATNPPPPPTPGDTTGGGPG